jgi:DNA invertase Pin-like site-specific DNA recombinase
MIVAEVIIREFQKIGVRVISASGGVDLTEGDDSNPTAKLIRQILAAVSEFDRCCIVLKLRGARDRKRAETGKCEGRRAFGDKDGERTILDRMIALRSDGQNPEQIAGILNNEGVPTRGTKKGKGPWKAATIAKILARHIPMNNRAPRNAISVDHYSELTAYEQAFPVMHSSLLADAIVQFTNLKTEE